MIIIDLPFSFPAVNITFVFKIVDFILLWKEESKRTFF